MSKLSTWFAAKLTSLLLRVPTATAVMAVGAVAMAFRFHQFIHVIGFVWGR
jgi:hypothetical protein